MGAVTVHRECVGVCGDGARPDDRQTDQCGDDDVVHISSPKGSSIDVSFMWFWVDWPAAAPVLPGPVMATCSCERKYQLSLELIERRYRSAGIVLQRRTTIPGARGSANIRITPRADVGFNAIQGRRPHSQHNAAATLMSCNKQCVVIELHVGLRCSFGAIVASARKPRSE